MKRKDTACLLPDKFSPAKQEGTYVILKLYQMMQKKFLGKGESKKKKILLNSKPLAFQSFVIEKNIVWPTKEIMLIFQ